MEAFSDSSEATKNLILLCVDESEHSVRAFEWFCENFYQKQHVLGLAHVHPSAISAHNNKLADVETDYEAKVDEVIHKSSVVIQGFLERAQHYGIKTKVFTKEKVDSVGRTICNIVKEENPCCVVIGQRGLGAVKRTIYGSVSDYVLHHAHVPVIIVPPPKDKI